MTDTYRIGGRTIRIASLYDEVHRRYGGANHTINKDKYPLYP